NDLWAYCRDHGIPMWSGEMLYRFSEARAKAGFDNLNWDGSHLGFTFHTPTAGQQLTLMVPYTAGSKNLIGVKVDGSNVAYTIDTIKGRTYGLFTVTAANADVVASYGLDTTPPVLSAIDETDVDSGSATIEWNTDEAADSKVEYGTAPSPLNHSKTSA